MKVQKKYRKYLLIIICFLFIFIIKIKYSFSYPNNSNNVENIYRLENADAICNAVKEKDIFTINIYNYQGYTDEEISEMLNNLGIDSLATIGIKKIDDYNYQIMTPSSSCINNGYRDKFISNVNKGDEYPPWVYIGRMTSSSVAYIDDVIVKKAGEINGDYSFLRIMNSSRKYNSETNKLTWGSTRKPTEKIYLSIDLTTKNLQKTGDNNDLRLSFSYGADSSNNIGKFDSVAYYLFSNNTKYGPYKMDYATAEKVYYENSSKITIYNLVSENLFNNIPSNTIIDKIIIIPYENYPLLGGELKLYDLSIDKYENNYIPDKEYLDIPQIDLLDYNDTEDLIRHNIIDDRMTSGLVKWRGSDDESRIMKVYYSTSQASAPVVFDNTIRYGFPYTTANIMGSTLYLFLDQMTYDEESGLYSYHIPTTYKKNTKAMKGTDNEIIQHYKDEEINGNLYVINAKGDISTLVPQYKADLNSNDFNNPNIEFISNNDGYVYGHSCSTSVYIPIARQIPLIDYVSSYDYFYNGNVKMINLDLTMKEVETALRCTGKLNSESFMTSNLFNQYYSNVLKLKYTEQQIYNAYALAIPGDTFSHSGHVRIVSGYSHVECVNDNQVTNNYYEGFCDNHGGIDPKNSYVITTEGGTSFVFKGNIQSNVEKHISSNETGWSYKLDSRYTDITDVDEIYTNSNIKTGFRPNFKYTFEELYGKYIVDSDTGDIEEEFEDDDEGDNNDNGNTLVGGLVCPSYLEGNTLSYQKSMYMPFRYKEFDNIKETNAIEKTEVKLFLEKEYSNYEYLSYLLENKKIKGTIISNYLIDGIKIDINDETYYIYPNMTNTYSLYRSLRSDIVEKIANLDYSQPIHIKVSVKTGPELNAIKQAYENGIDDNYYITVLEVKSPVINYYQGNGTDTAGTTKFDTITECAYNNACSLANYNNLTNQSFPQNNNEWKFGGYSTTIDGINIDYNGGQSFTYDLTDNLDLYVIGIRNFRFSSGIAPTSNSGNIPQFWNPYKTGTSYVTSINIPEADIIQGWTFIGYRANNTASSTVTIKASDQIFKPSPTNLTTLDFRAIYKRNITLKFDTNGGTGTIEPITQVQYYNSGFGINNGNSGANISKVDFTLANNSFNKKGCTFKGWGETPNSTSIMSPHDNYTNFKPDVSSQTTTKTLYAIWENENGTITFNSNFGTNKTIYQNITFNTNTKLSNNTFTRNGYLFKEWNTKADGTGTKYNNEQIVNINENIILYAIWEESFDYEITKYSVDYNNNIINNIKIKTTLEEFKKYIKTNDNYSININYKTVNNTNLLYTGGKTKIYKDNKVYKEFTHVVIGDINGDALINSADLLKMKQHLLNINVLTGAYYKASDINIDQKINSADLLRVRQYLLGLKDI